MADESYDTDDGYLEPSEDDEDYEQLQAAPLPFIAPAFQFQPIPAPPPVLPAAPLPFAPGEGGGFRLFGRETGLSIPSGVEARRLAAEQQARLDARIEIQGMFALASGAVEMLEGHLSANRRYAVLGAQMTSGRSNQPLNMMRQESQESELIVIRRMLQAMQNEYAELYQGTSAQLRAFINRWRQRWLARNYAEFGLD